MKTVEEVQEYLEQSGVKGMKWGVRKGKRPLAVSPKTGQPFPRTAESKAVGELRGRHPTQLSNKQLKTVNERMQLEDKFIKMNPDKIKKGLITAAKIMAAAQAGVTVYNLTKSPAGKAAIANGKRALGIKPKYGQMKLF